MVIAAAALGESAQGVVRALGATTLISLTLWRLHRDPDITRGPWLWIVSGGLLALTSAVVRVAYSAITQQESPFPSPAEIPGYASYVLIIVAARSFSRHRSRRREAEAGLDGFIVASATAVVVFAAILSDYVRDDAVSLAARAGNVGYSLLTITLVAYVARLAVGPGIRNTAWRLIAIATGLIVTNDLLLLLDTTGSTWALVAAGITSPAAFFAATGAILHPDAAQLTEALRYHPPTLSRTRLALLGAALLTLPAALLVAGLRGTAPDVPVLATGSAVLASLTLGRLMILFRARERVGDLERALRESGRSFIDATTPAEIASATAHTLQLVVGDDTRFAAVISSGPDSRHLITRVGDDSTTKVRPLSSDSAAPSLHVVLGSDASEVDTVTLELGESARLGSIVIDNAHGLDDAHRTWRFRRWLPR
jgi:hypothetical protein